MALDLRLDSKQTPLVTDRYKLTKAASYFRLR
jgi:hypothetical protein